MKAVIKIVTAHKQFTPGELDCFRRILNVLHSRDLSAVLIIKEKVKTTFTVNSHLKLKAV